MLELIDDANETGKTVRVKVNACIDEVNILKPNSDLIAEHERQLNMDTSKLGVDIDTILTTGYYEVNTNLPYGLTLGELRVGYDTENTSMVIQEYTDLHEAVNYRRQWNGIAFTPWQETPQSIFNDDVQLFATNLAHTKADITYVNSTIINTYTGNTPPDDTFGKNGDKYHQYATEAPLTDMLVGNSLSKYDDTTVFGLFFDPTATGIEYIGINATNREIYIDFSTDGVPSVNNIILEIDGNPITASQKYQTATNITLMYNNSFDSIVQSIVSNTPFKLQSKGLSGSETDYTKAQGRWFITPIYDHTFDHIGTQGVVIKDSEFTEIVRLTTPTRDAGTYQITFNVNAQYSSTTSSMRFRYSTDGGKQWSPTVWKEPKYTSDEPVLTDTDAFLLTDTDASVLTDTDAFVLTDTFVYDFGGGVFDCIIQGACESATQTLTANFANIIVDRKA